MNNTNVTIGASLVAAVVLGGLFGAAITNANDDPTPTAQVEQFDKDKAFLTFLDAKDVGTTSDADAVTMGNRVASMLRDEGVHPWMVGTRLVTLGYTGDEAATIVGATVAVYAQEFAHFYDE